MLENGAKVTITQKIGHDGRLIRIESIANEVRDVLPVLHQLFSSDDSTRRVYLCHAGVTHVSKMSQEGGFCGYRNIQMMISYIQHARHLGHELFPGRIPSILDLQVMIENAWDAGYGAIARTETGGIKGTRKYIGTPEVSQNERMLRNQGLMLTLTLGKRAFRRLEYRVRISEHQSQNLDTC